MNSDQHAHNSAVIFGGKSWDYLNLHETIDLNKLASSSVMGRFFLHHIDIGYSVLKAIFGENIPKSDDGILKVSVYELLVQHLLEDYAEMPSFVDWLEGFDKNFKKLPIAKEGKYLLSALKEDPILITLSEREISKIEEIFTLKKFTENKNILDHPARYCVFAHATGLHLAHRILGEKIGGKWTKDILNRYLDVKFGFVPTLVDFEMLIEDRDWMYAPEDYDRVNPEISKTKLEAYLKSPMLRPETVKDTMSAFADLSRASERDPEGMTRRIREINNSRPRPQYNPGAHRNCHGKGVMD